MVVLMRPFGVQKGCVKIAELFVSILFAPVAQRIERRFPKPCVGGSSPLGGASIFRSAFAGLFIASCALRGWLKNMPRGYSAYGTVFGRCVYSGADLAIALPPPLLIDRFAVLPARPAYGAGSMPPWELENKKSVWTATFLRLGIVSERQSADIGSKMQ